MNRRQLLELIAEGENLTTEFKLHFSEFEKIAKEIIAFANTKGGVILFGVRDSGKILGVESEKGETELIIETLKNYCEPAIKYRIKYVEFNGKEIVVLNIPESKNKPHRIQDYETNLNINKANVYVRVNDKSILASKEMIKLMQVQINQLKLQKYSIGKNEKKVFEYLNKNDFITAKQLCQFANLSQRRASRTLINMVRANILAIHIKENGEDIFSSI